ncbi:hypothetical protein BJ165DRAFT_229899 [Panaeolus papilionaceus]|nr:hypothetical protein BJ165DRAFT_229899 [Panaeolus papilionaceus]
MDCDDLPLARFFAQYEDQGFYYCSSSSASDEFGRLCKHLRFPSKPAKRKNLEAYKEVRQAYDDALTMQFNEVYGTDMEDYSAWYDLCSRIGIYPIPDTVRECRKVSQCLGIWHAICTFIILQLHIYFHIFLCVAHRFRRSSSKS